MKIAILYICTGKYNIFWKEFYLSCEKYFLNDTDIEKHYFVFTDAQCIYNENKKEIQKIYQENLGWPENTLFRYKIFAAYLDKLIKYDYIFFLNANIQFLKKVSVDILPKKNEVLVVQHPGFYNKSNLEFTYERNEKSLAYIPSGHGEYYICGGINGGSGCSFVKMIEELNNDIQIDYQKNIIAVWHDESHINKYIMNHSFKILSPSYGFPEGWDIPYEPIILIRDKNKYGGHKYLRNRKDTLLGKCKYFFGRMFLKGEPKR